MNWERGLLSEYIRSFIINQNKLKDFDQLLQYNPLILTEVVNTGTTISLSAKCLKQLGFQTVEVASIAIVDRQNLEPTKLDSIDKFYCGQIIPPENVENSFCVLTSTDIFSLGIMDQLPYKSPMGITIRESSVITTLAKRYIDHKISSRISEIINLLKKL